MIKTMNCDAKQGVKLNLKRSEPLDRKTQALRPKKLLEVRRKIVFNSVPHPCVQ